MNHQPSTDQQPVLRPLTPHELSADQRRLYDAILGARSTITSHTSLTRDDGSLAGPFDPLLRTPNVGEAVQRLGLALRHHTSLPQAATESAILTTAAHHRAEFEWYAHVAIARTSGCIDDDDIARIERGESPHEPVAALGWRLASAVLAGTRLPDDVIADVTNGLSEQALVELVCTVGHYANLALLMLALDIRPPDDDHSAEHSAGR